MGILSAIFGGGSGKSAAEVVADFVDSTFTSDEERAQAQVVLEKLRQQPAALQVELNKVEAGHRSAFVAGWRPFIGWMCGVGFAYHFIIQPLLSFILTAKGVDLGDLPAFDITSLNTVLMGMLGLGGLRTFEKIKGKAK